MTESNRLLTVAWQQRCLDALRDTLDVNSDLKREMVQFLFDEGIWDASRLEWSAAVTKFNACLRPDTRENFSNLALWALCKRFERYHWFYAMAEDLGFEVRKKPTEERRIELLDRLVAGIEQANKLTAAALLELGNQPKPVRSHPALRDGAGNFDLRDEMFPFTSSGVANV